MANGEDIPNPEHPAWCIANSASLSRGDPHGCNCDLRKPTRFLPAARANCPVCKGTGWQDIGNGTTHGCTNCYPQLTEATA